MLRAKRSEDMDLNEIVEGKPFVTRIWTVNECLKSLLGRVKAHDPYTNCRCRDTKVSCRVSECVGGRFPHVLGSHFWFPFGCNSSSSARREGDG